MKKTDIKTYNKEEIIEEKIIIKRRKFLAGITTGVAVAGITSGGKWVKPVVDSVSLPAHAQTSGIADMRLQGRVSGNEFNAYQGNVVFTDGTNPITSDAGVDFDNFNADFSALFEPIQMQSVSVNLDVNVDATGGPGDLDIDGTLSQTSSANIPVDGSMRANFTSIDVGHDTDTGTVTVVGTIQAQGYATRRITYVIT